MDFFHFSSRLRIETLTLTSLPKGPFNLQNICPYRPIALKHVLSLKDLDVGHSLLASRIKVCYIVAPKAAKYWTVCYRKPIYGGFVKVLVSRQCAGGALQLAGRSGAELF